MIEFFCGRIWCGASCNKTLQGYTAHARHVTCVSCVIPLRQQVVVNAPEEQPQSLCCLLCAEHWNAVSRIAPFKLKCMKYSFTEESIHHLDYAVDENVPDMRDARNRKSSFKLCQGFCHANMMSKRSEMMSSHYRIETHVSRASAAFGLALIPAGATQATSQVGNAVWSGSRMNLRNSLSNPLSVMHVA